MWGQGTFESSALSSTSTKAVVLSNTLHRRAGCSSEQFRHWRVRQALGRQVPDSDSHEASVGTFRPGRGRRSDAG